MHLPKTSVDSSLLGLPVFEHLVLWATNVRRSLRTGLSETYRTILYIDIDAQTFADWGIDYLSMYLAEFSPPVAHLCIEYDNCYNEGQAGTDVLSFKRSVCNPSP